MSGTVGRFWRGETSLWTSIMVGTLLVPALIAAVCLYIVGSLTVDHMPRTRIVEGLLAFGLIGLVAVWQLVGTWRASAASRAPQRSFVLRWFARLVALGVAAAGGALVATVPNGMAQLQALANGTDPIGRRGYTVSVQGNTLVYSGIFAWPALDAIEMALAGAPQVKTVVLDSPGGILPVGHRFAELVKVRGFDTLVRGECSSACTFVFLSGRRRVLHARGRLGFHAAAAVFGTDTALSNAAQRRAEAVLASHGLPAEFIARVSATAAANVWYPTQDELRRANVVTEIAR